MSKKEAAKATVRMLVPAAKATPSPPVGPALGQRGVKAIDFCKQFNDRTKAFLPGIPIPTVVTVNPDRTFTFFVRAPQTSWLLKQAAGIEKASSRPGEVIAGTVSLKHVYEIAKIKQNDPGFQGTSLRDVCARIIGQTRGMGIEVKK